MLEKTTLLKETIKELLGRLGFAEAPVEVTQKDNGYEVTVSGEGLGILIGYHGETLMAMQTWLSLVAYKEYGEWLDILLDISGYAAERENRLREIAINACDRARFLAKPIELMPMPAYERRIVHEVVATVSGMKSESIGEGFDRRIVVSTT